LAERRFPADVLLASSSEQVRSRWRHLLRQALVTHELGAQRELLRAVRRIKPDLVLLDLALTPGRVRAVRALHNASPDTKIIAFASVADEREGVGVLRAGARGYCDQHADGRLLEAAVRAVQHGEIWAERGIIRRLLAELLSAPNASAPDEPPPMGSRLGSLTSREAQVASLVGEGASNKEISCVLGISEKTVKCHLTATFRKVGLRDRLRLALLVRHDHVVDPPARSVALGDSA